MARTKTSVEQAAKRAMLTLRDLEARRVEDIRARIADAEARRDAAIAEVETLSAERTEAFGRLTRTTEVIASLGWADGPFDEVHHEDGTLTDSEGLRVGPFEPGEQV